MPLNPKDVKSPALTEQMVGKGEKMKKKTKATPRRSTCFSVNFK